MNIPVVENPRRRRGRRRLTAAQKRAGFGGRSAMRRRRRNPLMATLAGNPRRRRRGYAVRHTVYRRRRNPGLFDFKSFDLPAAGFIAAGMLGSDLLPNLGRKFWPALPGSGIMGYAVRLAGAFGTAYVLKMVTRSNRAFSLALGGGIASILLDVFRTYAAPMIGLSGLGADATPVYAHELRDVYGTAGYVDNGGVSGYVDASPVSGLGGYVASPQGIA